MKHTITALLFVAVISVPLFAQGETSSSASSSGNASSAAIAVDENGSSLSSSGENTSITISGNEISPIETKADLTIGTSDNETINPTMKITGDVKLAPDDDKEICPVSNEKIDGLTKTLKDFSPVSDRTVKILKLLAAAIIGIATVLVLQIIIILKMSRRRFSATHIQEGLNKF